MNQNLFLKIFFGLVVFMMLSFSLAGYTYKRALTADPEVMTKIAKHYNIHFQTSGNGFLVTDNGANAEKTQKNWDIEGAQKELKIFTKNSDVIVEKSPDSRLHLFAEGELMRENPADELYNVEIESGEVTIKEGRTRDTSLRIQVPSHIQEISFRSISGNLNANDINGQEVQVATVSGDVSLDDVSFKSMGVMTVSGDVEIFSKASSEIKVASTSGEVMIQTPQMDKSDIQLKTVSGDINNTFKSHPKSQHKVAVNTISGNIELRIGE